MSSSKKSTTDNSPSSWDSNSNEMDEKHFLRMYSKALAEALRTKEEEEAAEREELKQQKNSRNIKSSSTAADDLKIQSAYRELCHDDPIVTAGDRVCRQLAEVLVPKYKTTATRSTKSDNSNLAKLALSSPLVEGVLQAVARAGSKATSSTKQANKTEDTSQNNEDNKSPPNDESMIGSSNITSSEGYAQLAFAIFLEGPYRCIQQDNLDVISQFLGSFQPPEKTNSAAAHEGLSAEEKSRLVEEATAKIVDGIEKMSMEEDKANAAKNDRDDDASSSSSEFFLHNKNNNVAKEDNNDSMEEIWAEDSDPDDFEYESSYNPYNNTTGNNDGDGYEDDMDGDYFNPTQLSNPDPTNQTWEGARKSIYHLLSSFSYGNMALNLLSSRTWSALGMSESLGDLAFTLLLANTNGSSDSNSLLWRDKQLTQEDVDDDITTLWDRPLFALRDRAMDNIHGHDALSTYLQLLCAFLSHSEEDIMSILSSPSKDTNNTNDLPPLTAVGLSSFATLCTSKEMTCSSSAKLCGTSIESVCPRDEVSDAIFNSIDTLGHIIECVRPKKSVFGGGITGKASDDNSTTESWVRTAVCIIPMLEYLINIQARFDFQTVFEGGGSRRTTLSDPDAKALLDSGLFRELLSLYTCTQDESDASNVVRLQLLRTIFALSVQAPEILGRYAIRVPDLVKEVHASIFMDENLVDGILWTALGSSLLESKLEAPKPRLKLRTNAKLNLPPVDTSSLAERCNSGFEQLCKSCNSALTSYKFIVEKEDQSEADENEARQHKETLGSIVKFSNYLSNCPHGIKIWLDSLNNNEDAPQKAKKAIADLRSTLARLPSYAGDETGVKGVDHKKDDDNDNSSTDDHSEIRQKATSLMQRRKDFRQVVSLVRSSVKVIALALESQKGTGLSLKTPMSSYNASSKTD
ncbi:hypothetical protein QTG54_006020 [Skeletonema marinoi]|uniref:Uncharacterized protein n=1 Tax=Skeletonema marinoi TaxID=267567 RepID=A0AAD9DEN9_9STRA|nr:hypothetical protein QTG54_006020 [Skeletonema marinoi]